nr:DNA excision repair protein ERCC-8-like isoform X2 [Halyomorpha halys]
MDLLKFYDQRKAGFMTCHKFGNLMDYELLKRIYSCSDHEVSKTKFTTHATDFSLQSNRLLVAHPGTSVSLYDVTKPSINGYKCLNVWTIQTNIRPGLESINWNPSMGFFTYSARDKHLICVDVETMTEIERIELRETTRIFQHKPSPQNPEMIAVGSPLPKVVLIDLRSGNITSTAPYHPTGVLSVSWCGINENLLATAGENGVVFWDVRHFRKPICFLIALI